MKGERREVTVKKPIWFFFSNIKRKKKIYTLTKKLSSNAQGTPCLSKQRKHTNVLCVSLWAVNLVLAVNGSSITNPKMREYKTKSRAVRSWRCMRLV